MALNVQSAWCFQVENVEAKVGRKGFIKMKGSLPMALHNKKAGVEAHKGKRNGLALDINALEMRLRNAYTGIGLRTSKSGLCL